MEVDRRKFIGISAAAGLSSLVGSSSVNAFADAEADPEGYRFRIAFDAWINDVRNEAMTLDNWPYGVFDDQTVDGIVKALDIQSQAGYNVIDLLGLWTTYAWPLDIEHVVDKDQQRRIARIVTAAHDRKMKVICFPSGILNWGFDKILQAHPELGTDNKHEMNPFKEESWKWLYRVFDYAADNYDIDGFHLEAADQGRCKTPECMENWPDNVAYYCYVTGRLADYLRQKHRHMLLVTTIQGFSTWGKGFSAEQVERIVDLSKKVDCMFDQGHRGTYVSPSDWGGFIPKLHCAYGTSGGIWVYPPQRWNRTRWFLPYVQRTGQHMRELYQAGGRGVMYYQGPVENPSTEVNMDFGGRMMTQTAKSIDDILGETLEHLYQPKSSSALQKLIAVYKGAEDAYFEQWNQQRIEEVQKAPPPGELHLTNLFGASPGASTYLMEPLLDTQGRLKYKQDLTSVFRDLSIIEDDFHDGGRILRMKQGISEALVDINNIGKSKNESEVWDDQRVGRQY